MISAYTKMISAYTKMNSESQKGLFHKLNAQKDQKKCSLVEPVIARALQVFVQTPDSSTVVDHKLMRTVGECVDGGNGPVVRVRHVDFFAELQFHEGDEGVYRAIGNSRAAHFVKNKGGVYIQCQRLPFLRTEQDRWIELNRLHLIDGEHSTRTKEIVACLLNRTGHRICIRIVHFVVDQHRY